MRSVDSAERRPAVVLRLDAVGLRIGALEVLREVSLSLRLDERTVVVGPNGAGKSTLLQVMHRLLPPHTGTVETFDALGRPSRARLALVFQRPVMLRRSVLGNVEHALAISGVPAATRRARAAEALAEVGLAYASARPARRLSGGEQQRLAVARAQALAPDCLLLDEPTASLDPASGAAIERHLLGLSARGIGLVMTTHDLAQARRVAQRVVMMHRGRVVEDAEAAAFFGAPRTEAARRFLAGDWLD